MSQMGQTRRFRDVRGMSGLPPTADISGHGRNFTFVPIPDIGWQLGRSRAEPHGRLHRGLSAVPRSDNLLLFEYWKWRFSLGVARRRRDFITLLGGAPNDAPFKPR